ncbi:hypothetical protein [Rossellomorea sp. NRS-1567]|uniref:hypothetical protein n=1 Tax=Rossellomorea sp. NRS-1567 TaxID=3233901 RepID=UPI003D2E7489
MKNSVVEICPPLSINEIVDFQKRSVPHRFKVMRDGLSGLSLFTPSLWELNTMVIDYKWGDGFMELATILCGPIIRRVEPAKASIWIALSKPYDIKAELFKIKQGDHSHLYDYKRITCETETKTVQAGKNLYISIMNVSPHAGSFPTDKLLGYNLLFENSVETLDLGSFDLLSPTHPHSIVYENLAYPTFYMNEGNTSNILYGSCRKLHGVGTDVLVQADKTIASTFNNADRPSSLFLMGDQIYADDVADPLFKIITRFGKELVGQEEDLGSIEPRLKEDPFKQGIKQINGRQYITEHFCKFTSRKAANHLFSLSDYAAMYILSWNPSLWELAHKEGMFETFQEAMDKNEFYFVFKDPETKEHKFEYRQLQARYQKQMKELAKLEESLYSVRRVLANTPTYMMFDDHDITDDWNLTQDWKRGVWNAPLGRHVISNGLASYWLFQSWGNEPDTFTHFGQTMQTYFDSLQPGSLPHSNWIHSLWNYDSWHYTAPTTPIAVFLDTRTQRGYVNKPNPVKVGTRINEERYSPNLLHREGWNRISTKLAASGWKKGESLIMVSPSPLYGIGLIENFLHDYMLPLRTFGLPVQSNFDLEAWKYNGKGFSDFLHQIAAWDPSDCIILSGDVHSASSVQSDITFRNGRRLKIHQFTSSPIKNMSYTGIWGAVMKFIIALNARKRTNRTIYRYCNHQFDLFREEQESGVPSDYVWKENIRYLNISESSLIEIKNNIGWLRDGKAGPFSRLIV